MMKRFWALAYALALATSPALAHDNTHKVAPSRHDSELGSLGKASEVTSTIRVRMQETADGGMAFYPALIIARPGETLRLMLENDGASEHEFILGTPEELAEHAAMMREMPDMSHDDPNAMRLQPGGSGEIIWKFGASDRIEFACLVPGHYEAGMRGRVIVRTTSAVNGG